MQKHDADRVNGAFAAVARENEQLKKELSALKNTIQTLSQEQIALKKQVGLLASNIVR